MLVLSTRKVIIFLNEMFLCSLPEGEAIDLSCAREFQNSIYCFYYKLMAKVGFRLTKVGFKLTKIGNKGLG